jgi:hypothetical protein
MRAEDFRGPALTNRQMAVAGLVAFFLTAVLAAAAFGVRNLLVDEHPAPPCARFDGIERDNCLYGRVTPG